MPWSFLKLPQPPPAPCEELCGRIVFQPELRNACVCIPLSRVQGRRVEHDWLRHGFCCDTGAGDLEAEVSEDPHPLDYEGAVFILIGARVDPERAYGIDIETEHETARNAGIFRQLKMSPRERPIAPLTRANGNRAVRGRFFRYSNEGDRT